MFKKVLYIVLFGALFSNCGNRESSNDTNNQPAIDVQAENEQEAVWEYLFDGKTLDGWKKLGGDATYHIDGDMIVGTTAPVSDTTNSFLVTEKHYDNFILEFEVILDLAPNNYHNSGVQIRSNSLPEYRNGLVHGYQVEIDPDTTARSGGIYDEGRRGWVHDLHDNPAAKKAFKLGEWNSYRVEANGPSIKTWLNDVPAADYNDSLTSTGFIGLQVHSTDSEKPLQIKWRNIRIKAL
ncbi:MAG: 3-keto-disaccharide hydrolase [Cyclobacteriaceae bacterium]